MATPLLNTRVDNFELKRRIYKDFKQCVRDNKTLADHLYSQGMLTESEKAEFASKLNRLDANECLLNHLVTKYNWFRKLQGILRDDSVRLGWLANSFQDTYVGIPELVEKKFFDASMGRGRSLSKDIVGHLHELLAEDNQSQQRQAPGQQDQSQHRVTYRKQTGRRAQETVTDSPSDVGGKGQTEGRAHPAVEGLDSRCARIPSRNEEGQTVGDGLSGSTLQPSVSAENLGHDGYLARRDTTYTEAWSTGPPYPYIEGLTLAESYHQPAYPHKSMASIDRRPLSVGEIQEWKLSPSKDAGQHTVDKNRSQSVALRKRAQPPIRKIHSFSGFAGTFINPTVQKLLGVGLGVLQESYAGGGHHTGEQLPQAENGGFSREEVDNELSRINGYIRDTTCENVREKLEAAEEGSFITWFSERDCRPVISVKFKQKVHDFPMCRCVSVGPMFFITERETFHTLEALVKYCLINGIRDERTYGTGDERRSRTYGKIITLSHSLS